MVSVVLGGAAPQAKGHQVMQGPGEDVAAVLLHGNVDVEDHEAPGGQAVALEQDGVHRGPKPHAEELPAGEVLGDEAEGLVVLVVDGVERAVQPRYLVMQQVPEVILEVKEHHAAQDAQDEAQEWGRLTRQQGGRPPEPLRHRSREDVQHVVVDGDGQGGPDVGPGDGPVWVEPAAVDAGPGGGQQVQDGVDPNQDEVGADRENGREGGTSQEVVVVQQEVVPNRLQDRALGLALGHVLLLQHFEELAGAHRWRRVPLPKGGRSKWVWMRKEKARSASLERV